MVTQEGWPVLGEGGEIIIESEADVSDPQRHEFIVDDQGNIIFTGRTNSPAVYTYNDLPAVAKKYRVYESYRFNVEAQVWDREMLHRYWLKIKGENQ